MPGQIIGFAEIAEKMGVVIRHARRVVSEDPDFPKPITPPSLRSPGFDEEEVDRYLEQRAERSMRRVGRPPATVAGQRVKLSPEQLEEIRLEFRGRSTIASAARALGISEVTMRFRLNGTSSWLPSELPKLAKHLGVSEAELLGK